MNFDKTFDLTAGVYFNYERLQPPNVITQTPINPRKKGKNYGIEKCNFNLAFRDFSSFGLALDGDVRYGLAIVLHIYIYVFLCTQLLPNEGWHHIIYHTPKTPMLHTPYMPVASRAAYMWLCLERYPGRAGPCFIPGTKSATDRGVGLFFGSLSWWLGATRASAPPVPWESWRLWRAVSTLRYESATERLGTLRQESRLECVRP